MNPTAATSSLQRVATGDSLSPIFQDISTRTLLTTRIGEKAGKLGIGSRNVFIGYEAGRDASAATQSVCIGFQAGAATVDTDSAVFVGALAGAGNQGGQYSVFVGYRCGELNNSGYTLTGVGAFAMRETYAATLSTAVGFRAMERLLNGTQNTAVGAEAAQDLRSGVANTIQGFRAGRATQGSYNSYFGAWCGYSNEFGDYNCFIGAWCGAYLTAGSYNIAIGAGALGNATVGNSNVIIGADAGGGSSSGADAGSSRNVILGTAAGSNATTRDSVLIGNAVATRAAGAALVVIGAEAAPQVAADGSVIIGYAAGDNLIYGASNVLVGPGANSYTTSNSYGISIGTTNALTSDYSITVGGEIQNRRAYSILVGHNLQSDANNSVVLGNDIALQSVIYFKDPLSKDFTAAVAADASTKIGAEAITYGFSNQLLESPAPESAAFLYATAGWLTSNLFDSQNPICNVAISPASFNIRDFLLTSGAEGAGALAVAEIMPRALVFRSNAEVPAADVAIPASNLTPAIFLASNAAGAPGAPGGDIRFTLVPAQPVLFGSNVLTTEFVPVEIQTSNASAVSYQLWTNIWNSNTVPAGTTVPAPTPAPVPVSKTAQRPYFDLATSNLPRFPFDPSGPAAGFLESRVRLTSSNTSVVFPENIRLIAAAGPAPAYGFWDSNTHSYRPYPECAYAAADRVSIEPVQVIDNRFGIVARPFADPGSNLVLEFIGAAAAAAAAEFYYTSNIALNTPATPSPATLALTSNNIRGIPHIPPETPLRIRKIPAGAFLTIGSPSGPGYASNVIDQMIAENIDAYPDSALAAVYFPALHSNAASNIAPAIAARASNAAGLPLAGIATTTDALKIHVLSNALLPIEPVLSIASNTSDLAARLNSNTFAAITEIPGRWVGLSNEIGAWFSSNDPGNTLYAVENAAFNSYISLFETDYYYLGSPQTPPAPLFSFHSNVLDYTERIANAAAAAGPAASNALAILYETTAAPGGLSNLIHDYAFSPLNVPTIADSNLYQGLLDQTALYYHKYIAIPRLFTFYSNIIPGGPGGLGLSNVPTAAASTLEFGLSNIIGPRTIQITPPIPGNAAALWNTFPYAYTRLAAAADAALVLSNAWPGLPASSNTFIFEQPTSGILRIPAGDSNLRGVAYLPRNPYQTDADPREPGLVAAADLAGSIGADVFLTPVPPQTPTSIRTQTHFAVPVATAVPAYTDDPAPTRQFIAAFSNIAVYSNLDIARTTSNGVPDAATSNYAAITVYDPAYGHYTRTSNIAWTSALTLTPNPGNTGLLTLTRYYLQSNLDYDFAGAAGPLVIAPLTSNITTGPSANPAVDSNLALTWDTFIVQSNYLATHRTFTVDTLLTETSNHRNAYDQHWVWSNVQTTPIVGAVPALTTAPILTPGNVIDTTSNLHVFKTIELRENYAPLSRWNLWTSNAAAVYRAAAPSIVVRSNVSFGSNGDLGAAGFTQADIAAGAGSIYLRVPAAPADTAVAFAIPATDATTSNIPIHRITYSNLNPPAPVLADTACNLRLTAEATAPLFPLLAACAPEYVAGTVAHVLDLAHGHLRLQATGALADDTTLPYGPGPGVALDYAATLDGTYTTYDQIRFVISDRSPASNALGPVRTVPLLLTHTPRAQTIDLAADVNIAIQSNLLVPEAFYWSIPVSSNTIAADSNVLITLPAASVSDYDFQTNTFTMADIREQRVAIRVGSSAPAKATISYTLSVFGAPSISESGTIVVRKYTHSQLPRAEDWTAAATALRFRRLGLESATTCETVGDVWTRYIARANIGGVPVAASNLVFECLADGLPTRGFLRRAAPMTSEYVLTSWTLSNIQTSDFLYVANNPDAVENDLASAVRLRCTAPAGVGAVAPIFQLNLQNFYASLREEVVAVNTGAEAAAARTLVFDRDFQRSAGLRAAPPSAYVWRRGSNLDTSWTLPLGASNLAAAGGPGPQATMYLVPAAAAPAPAAPAAPASAIAVVPDWFPATYKRSAPAQLLTGLLSVALDEADSIALADCGLDAAIVYSSNGVQGLEWVVESPPSSGVLVDSRRHATAVPAPIALFRHADAPYIRYQHFGGGSVGPGVGSDEFRLGLRTTPYDLSSESLRIAATIRPLPRFARNRPQFFVHSTVADALATIHSTSNAIEITGGTAPTLHVRQASPYAAFAATGAPGVPLLDFPASNLANQSVGVNIQPAMFALPSSNAPIAASLVLNNRPGTGAGAANPLIDRDPAFASMFAIPYQAYLNTVIHSNVRRFPTTQSNIQVLDYTINSNLAGSSNFDARIVNISLQIRPTQGYVASSAADSPSAWLNTYDWTFRLLDFADAEVFSARMTHSNVYIRAPLAGVQATFPVASYPFARLAPNVLGNISFYNQDPDNQNRVSFYVNDNAFFTQDQHIARNLLRTTAIAPFNFIGIHRLRVETDLSAPLNFYPALTITRPPATPGPGSLATTYQLSEYATTLNYQNFVAAITTYRYTDSQSTTNAEAAATTAEVQNVIIGKALTVRGVDNICIGNLFTTSGANSIIIGNKIGIGADSTLATIGQVNDIYESIIIGTTSYQNSIVRNIISIGRDIYNNLYTAPLTSVNAFLAQKPIIIGNSIDVEKLDFHINIGNAFLKTSVGAAAAGQIYLGVGGEAVAVGMTENVGAAAASPLATTGLYVAGNLAANQYQLWCSLTAESVAGGAVAGDLVLATGGFANLGGRSVAEVPVGVLSRLAGPSVLVAAMSLGILVSDTTVCHRGIAATRVSGAAAVVVGDRIAMNLATGAVVVGTSPGSELTLGRSLEASTVVVDGYITVRVLLA